ncbi:MAG: hypothetical protein PHO01_10810 [Desulfotomaculaceae bacterium]|nr:hypothetical protein [Desulfotomaculaceae bacterium]
MRKALVLLNVHDGKLLSRMLGIGFESACLIVKPYHRYNVFHVLGSYKSDLIDGYEQGNVTQNADGSRCFSPQIATATSCDRSVCDCKNNFENLCIAEKARVVENILATDFEIPKGLASETLGSGPAALPESQFKQNYLALEGKWNITDQQVTNNSLVMEISLIASYNPKYKYLRIRSVGAGFSPANGGAIEYDSTYDRGHFQGNIKVHMQPNTDKLRTLSTEPKNVNNQTQYTTGSQFTVGVDISKNPSYNSSYTISESITTVVSDFNIYNNGAGVTADWDWVMSKIEHSFFDIFDEQTARKAKVKSVPELAKKNLQAVTETVWYADNTLNESIGVQLYWWIKLHRAYVTGDLTNYTEHHHWNERTVGFKDTPVYIDFSSVHA